MKAVIPTGGRGTRMQPLTFSTNKHFIPVANKPLIFYPIETVAESGVKEVAITYNPGWLPEVKSMLGDGSRWGLKFEYILQEKPKGLANIFEVCEEYLSDEPFFLHLGDNIFADGIKPLVSHFEKEQPDGLVAMVHHKENTRLGVPYFDKKGRLIQYVEKPENPPHDFAIPGIYFFNKNVFKCFRGKDAIKPSPRGEYEISAPYQWLIDHNFRVDVMEYRGKWLDPGKFDDWLEANRFLLKTRTKKKIGSKLGGDTKIEGEVEIGEDCKILGSKIIGPTSIGDNVQIENSMIGPNTSVYNNSTLISVKIKNSVIMGGVKMSDISEKIEESLVGTNSSISKNIENGKTMSIFVGEKSQIKL